MHMKPMLSWFKLFSATTAMLILAWSPAFAVHDNGLFELDVDLVNGVLVGNGDTINDPALPGEDWINVYNGTSSAFATAFIVDTFGNATIAGFPTPENSFFTGGGSKDTEDIPSWQYDTVNDVVPDKNDIVTAFAAAYDDPADNHTIFYFGLDTYSVQGASNAGFWFFRQPVTLVPLAPGATTGTFNGEHSDGDIFVSVSYEQGGKVGLVEVYTWDSTPGPGNKPIGPVLKLTSADADCANAPANDEVCGVINMLAGEDPPWDYRNKAGGSTYESAAFVEFGLDVTALLGSDIGCFSSFMAETRSAPALTAQLKDFALGGFEVCGIDVKKEAGALSKVGDEIEYQITIENTGRATLYKQSISDSLLGDLTADAGCGASLAPGETCTIDYSYTVKAGDPDPLENTVSILYTEKAGGLGLQYADSYTQTVNLFQPAISFDKKAEGSDGPITALRGATVDYTLTVKNESSADTPALECTVTDPMLGINQTLTLTPGDAATISHSEIFAAPGTYLNTASVTCSPEGFPNVLEATDSVRVEVLAAANLISVLKVGQSYSKTGDAVDYTVTISNIGSIPLKIDAIVDENNAGESTDLTVAANYNSNNCPLSPAMLGVGASCTVTFTRATLATDPDPLIDEVTVTISDALGGAGSVADDYTVDLVYPDFSVSKSCLNDPVPAGQFASFQIDIINTGDVNLLLDVTDPLLNIEETDVLLGQRGGDPCLETELDGDATDGCYRLEGSVLAAGDQVTNLATVLATLPVQFGLPNMIEKTAEASCDVLQGEVTRTWGFWKTHGSDGTKFLPPDYPSTVSKGYTCYVAKFNLGFPIEMGWTSLQNCADVFGLFLENKAGCSQLEKAKLQASRQFLAAQLNYAAFGTAIPATCIGKQYQGMSTTQLFDAMLAALAGDDRQTIQKLAGIFACYNESGDEAAIVDSVPVPHADPNGTRAIADFDLIQCGK